ncbi:MAG: S41 family peptidase [Bacteroidales bacterium]|nr:S41 family peptidase [Bacteroidales bacterium]
MKKYSSVAVALLGILVGALLVLTIQKASENKRLLRTEYRDWRKINLVLQSLDENYVDTVNRRAVTDAAISAALGALDPHSVYMPPAVLEESETELAGNFDGIGIQFNVPNDTAIVLEVIPGGPSEKIGLQPGDRILKVDDRNIAGVKFPQDSMVRKMRGPSGSKVSLTVLRDGETVPFEITRGKIPMNSVDAAFMVSDTTGYLRLSKFARTTYQEVLAACSKLKGQGMKRLIFDLRDNGGGFFDQSIYLADMFLPKGAEIVYLEGRTRARQDYRASGKGTLQDIALDVLISEASASSSEIFAGAIQDNDRGVIYGRRSFGKGLVQEPLYFTDGSGLRITVARYHTPSGRCIQKPYSSSEDYAYDLYYRYRDGEMTSADSVKVNKNEEYHTVGGRTVYGGGGIVPDVFVPIDTTRASDFYVACNKKATAMRFASAYFDAHKAELQGIDSFPALERYLGSASLEQKFLAFAAAKDGLRPASAASWNSEKNYMMTSVRALVGRYSKLGDEAFYHIYLTIDNVFQTVIKK